MLENVFLEEKFAKERRFYEKKKECRCQRWIFVEKGEFKAIFFKFFELETKKKGHQRFFSRKWEIFPENLKFFGSNRQFLGPDSRPPDLKTDWRRWYNLVRGLALSVHMFLRYDAIQ